MKAVIQRINKGSVITEKQTVAETQKGLVVFLGITHGDTQKEINYLIRKIINLRIFSDDSGKMNLSVKDIEGEILLISQFTLYAECQKGMRPSFTSALEPDKAKKTYDLFAKTLKEEYNKTEFGVFGADMEVKIDIDGPVTIILETP